jgi:hypothetical protein
MSYYLDAEKITLEETKKRIQETDLIPSHAFLLEGLNENFEALQRSGIATLADLRKETKTAKRISSLADKTNIELHYLILLRRETGGYFPKPISIGSFDWLPKEECKRLEEMRLNDSVLLYEKLNTKEKRAAFCSEMKFDMEFLDLLFSLVELSRIQWVSPTIARMLIAAGFKSSKEIANADPEILYNSISQLNKEKSFYKMKIGLRDIKRLIKAADYVSKE